MKWLVLRRMSQLTILALFLLGPLADVWIIRGNLAGSTTLEVLPLTDPLAFLQILLTGHGATTMAWAGFVIVLCFYLLVGGRVFCSWICPVNIINDTGGWLRKRIRVGGHSSLGVSLRYWLLGTICIIPLTMGIAGWETINPVNITTRSLIFLQTEVLWIIGGLLLFSLLIRGGWCRICPTGALYSLIGHFSPLKIRSQNRETCDHCNACYQACPEPHVLVAPLNNKKGSSPVVKSGQCTNCGRCIDVCHLNIFKFGSRF